MSAPPDWDPSRAIASCPIVPWAGTAWRFHGRRYDATDHGGSLLFTARYNRGLDRFPLDQTWPVLYLALGPHIALSERLRHTTPDLLSSLNGRRLSELRVELASVLDCGGGRDCHDPAPALGLTRTDPATQATTGRRTSSPRRPSPKESKACSSRHAPGSPAAT